MATLCSKYHGRDTQAKAYTVRVLAHPGTEPSVPAKDGKHIALGVPFCGTHLNTLPPESRSRAVSVEMVESFVGFTNNDAALLDYLKGRYEAELDRQAEQRAADDRRYHERLVEDNALEWDINRETTFHNGLWGVELTQDGRAGTHVYVDTFGGVAKVGIADIMGTGHRGRGNASWVARLQEVLGEAVKVAEEYNAEHAK